MSKPLINKIHAGFKILKGKKKGKLEYGMCRIRVTKGGYLLKLLHALEDIIKNNSAPVVQRTEQNPPKVRI